MDLIQGGEREEEEESVDLSLSFTDFHDKRDATRGTKATTSKL